MQTVQKRLIETFGVEFSPRTVEALLELKKITVYRICGTLRS
jgi:hypothetical protein